jgi:NADPH-dependent 2,4-dienoyl-CoA reductase/sulfur reductase-like enzyme
VNERCDVAVVGAGPAGLAAATLCAERGLATVLFDEQPAPGGAIYRGLTTTPVRRAGILGDDYWQGASLLRPFERSGATYVARASVWAATPAADGGYELGVSVDGSSRTVNARALVLATGALERPFPIPGWTLPGVMTAGGAQALLKASGQVPVGPTVLAGCGPLLWLVAWQYLSAGVAVDALLETTPRGRLAQAMPHAAGFMLSDYLAKGLRLVRDVRRNVRVVEYVTALAAEGEGRLRRVRYEVDGAADTIPADLLLLHQGVVPNINLPHAIGCALQWNERQSCFEPTVDLWGGSSLPNLYIAGDAGGIVGTQAAAARGALAALAVANALGRIDGRTRDRMAIPHRADLVRALRGRAFFDTLYRPADAFRLPEGDTIVCRCEEVTAREVTAAVRAGCQGPSQLKAYTRCGMGLCQGRYCGLTVTEMIARERGVAPAAVGYYRLRFPVRPVTLGELAAMPSSPAAQHAVVREQGTH